MEGVFHSEPGAEIDLATCFSQENMSKWELRYSELKMLREM
jgi:hypothetical protein